MTVRSFDIMITTGRKSFGKDIEFFIEENLKETDRENAKAIDVENSVQPVAVEVDTKNLIETQTFFGWGTGLFSLRPRYS